MFECANQPVDGTLPSQEAIIIILVTKPEQEMLIVVTAEDEWVLLNNLDTLDGHLDFTLLHDQVECIQDHSYEDVEEDNLDDEG